MTNPVQGFTLFLIRNLRTVIFAVVVFGAITMMEVQLTAQTFTVLHSFTGGSDGANPYAGLTLDVAGNLYGTTYDGGDGNGTAGSGAVFKLAYRNSGWILTPLYSFAGGSDGANPYGGVIFGPDGSLYGTTYADGQTCSLSSGCGTVFNLKPTATACTSALCAWTETVLHRFAGGDDGGKPTGDVIFDQAGDMYGSTYGGISVPGTPGTVYELIPSNGGWMESVLNDFPCCNQNDGTPWGGVISDRSGNLYGATPGGGNGACFRLGFACGTVFELSRSSFGWVKRVLYNFQGGDDGGYPYTSVIRDNSGNLYGASNLGGPEGGGTVFMLSPLGGTWSFDLIYGLSLTNQCYTYGGPEASLTMDANGNLYGTATVDGAYTGGSAFKLTPSDGGWTYTDLHDFTGGSDGLAPISTVTFDASGNLYGTASEGGAYGYGTVWEITP